MRSEVCRFGIWYLQFMDKLPDYLRVLARSLLIVPFKYLCCDDVHNIYDESTLSGSQAPRWNRISDMLEKYFCASTLSLNRHNSCKSKTISTTNRLTALLFGLLLSLNELCVNDLFVKSTRLLWWPLFDFDGQKWFPMITQKKQKPFNENSRESFRLGTDF